MEMLIQFCFTFLNMGLACGFVLGLVWLLQPVTTRLLSPGQRLTLWWLGWLGSYIPSAHALIGVPMVLQNILAPRIGKMHFPTYLPEWYNGSGVYNLALPFVGAVPVTLNDTICLTIILVWLAGVCMVSLRMFFGGRKLKKLAKEGELLERVHPFYDLVDRDEDIFIWLCEDIPTSFIDSDYGKYHIYLEKDLTPQRMELVLRHEVNHLKLNHCWKKGIANAAIVFYWWNPLVWLAYFSTCRVLELECDERTIEELEPSQRREYAHALLEAAAGQQLWDAPLSFGECDAAVRVKALAAWKPRTLSRRIVTGLLTLTLALCFVGGNLAGEEFLPEDQELAWQQHVGEDPQQFVHDIERRLYKRAGVDHSKTVEAVWSLADSEPPLVYRLSDGTYWVNRVWMFQTNEIRFMHYDPFQIGEDVIDLSQYQKIY